MIATNTHQRKQKHQGRQQQMKARATASKIVHERQEVRQDEKGKRDSKEGSRQ